MGTLSIVAIPIGNMQDISLRAIKTLLRADVIACEDTRRAGLLLQKLHQDPVILNIVKDLKDSSPELRMTNSPRLVSYYEQNELQRIPEIISALKDGLNISLISDAGTPLVSDPGYKLIRECIKEGIDIESIPGPSAAIVALTLSGLPTDKFFFVGYPPRKEGHRIEFYKNLLTLKDSLKSTVIMYEAPHRIQGTLAEMADVFGKDKHLVIARELTKTYEQLLRDTVENLQKHFSNKEPKGEFVLLFQSE